MDISFVYQNGKKINVWIVKKLMCFPIKKDANEYKNENGKSVQCDFRLFCRSHWMSKVKEKYYKSENKDVSVRNLSLASKKIEHFFIVFEVFDQRKIAFFHISSDVRKSLLYVRWTVCFNSFFFSLFFHFSVFLNE